MPVVVERDRIGWLGCVRARALILISPMEEMGDPHTFLSPLLLFTRSRHLDFVNPVKNCFFLFLFWVRVFEGVWVISRH